jgi:hypothetical protein
MQFTYPSRTISGKAQAFCGAMAEKIKRDRNVINGVIGIIGMTPRYSMNSPNAK